MGVAMKVQYFGDRHDWFKYRSLLRLGDTKLPIGHFWMMTPPDGRPDGNHDILDRETKNLRLDESRLLEFIQAHRNDRDHGFKKFQTSGLLPRVKFFDEELPTHGGVDREALIQRCLASFKEQEVIFFDPDNGLEVRSNPYHQAESRQYVYLKELKTFFDAGKSLVVYQHKSFHSLDVIINSKMDMLKEYFKNHNIFIVSHTRILILFVVQPGHEVINYQLFESLLPKQSRAPLVKNETVQKLRCPHCNENIKISINAENS